MILHIVIAATGLFPFCPLCDIFATEQLLILTSVFYCLYQQGRNGD